jgi:hypothetical protein
MNGNGERVLFLEVDLDLFFIFVSYTVHNIKFGLQF